MEQLSAFFKEAGFKNENLSRILKDFTLKTFKKGDYFIEEGKTSRHLGFVAGGLFQYFVLANGEERTTYISGENSFVASLLSFLKQQPSREYIRCISDAELWQIEQQNLRQLLQDVPGFKDFYIGLLEYQVGCIDSSRLDFIMLTAEARYEKMLNEEPMLLQQIPLQYLASIIGVTPRHLSRIRRKIRY